MSNEEDQPKCPVDFSSRPKWTRLLWATKEEAVPKPSTADLGSDQPKCPVDHNTRTDWLNKVNITTQVQNEAIEVKNGESCTSDALGNPVGGTDVRLPTDRSISSIPRTSGDSNWIYPSEKQFFDAMSRKNWNPKAEDMKTVVPIHNMVNERTWNHILNWENKYYQQSITKCGGIKLTSFKGNPTKLTPRAWIRSNILGLEPPFDRHDWIVNRCGTEIEYVIDFYPSMGDDPNVFLDVRPKLNTWEGIKLRVERAAGWS